MEAVIWTSEINYIQSIIYHNPFEIWDAEHLIEELDSAGASLWLLLCSQRAVLRSSHYQSFRKFSFSFKWISQHLLRTALSLKQLMLWAFCNFDAMYIVPHNDRDIGMCTIGLMNFVRDDSHVSD